MKNIIITILLISVVYNIQAQFAAVLSKDGFVRLDKNSIKLSPPKSIRGDIQWQSTHDSIEWENIEPNIDDNLSFIPAETKSYRLTIKEGTCDSIISDTCIVFAANTTITEYLNYGISALDLFNAGIMVGTLEQNGVKENDLIEAELMGNVIDEIGNNYKWIKIGTQIWMAENLRTTKFNNGNSIIKIEDNTEWENTSSPAFCWYDNLSKNDSLYGALYNWSTVSSGNLCPVGWHVPSQNEWQTLINYLGGEDMAGGKLKQQGNDYWVSPNTGASNESGFAALPGGIRIPSYNFIGEQAYFWSSSEGMDDNAWIVYLVNNTESIFSEDIAGKVNGRSVRCIKD